MAKKALVLERRCIGPDFAKAVARFIRETAQIAASVSQKNSETLGSRRIRPIDPTGSLSRLANYVDGLTIEDQALRALQVLSPGRPEQYAPPPGGAQRMFLSRLTETTTAIDPRAALEEARAATTPPVD